MEKEKNIDESCKGKMFTRGNHPHCNCGSGAIYGLSVIGALFYFLQNATTFTSVIIGIGKAIFWPAILMFKLLTYLQI